MQVELILKIVQGTNNRYYVTKRGVVIHTAKSWYDAWDYLGEYESFLQEQDYRNRTSWHVTPDSSNGQGV